MALAVSIRVIMEEWGLMSNNWRKRTLQVAPAKAPTSIPHSTRTSTRFPVATICYSRGW